MGSGARKGGGGLGCGAQCVKITLITFNIIFLLVGAALLGVGIYILVDPNLSDNQDALDTELFDIALYIMVASGGVALLTAIMGMIGACCNSRTLLGLYAVLMFLFILGEIGAGVLSVWYNVDDLGSEIRTRMRRQAHYDVTDDTDDAVTNVWFRMQYYFECCGGKTYSDYVGSKYNGTTGDVVPKTCCKITNDDPINPEITPENYNRCKSDAETENEDSNILWTTGCYDAVTDWMKRHIWYILGIAVGIIIFEIVCIYLSCILMRAIRKM